MENPEVKQQNCCKKKSWRNAIEKAVWFAGGCLATYCCLNPNKVKNQFNKAKGYFQKEGQKGGEQ